MIERCSYTGTAGLPHRFARFMKLLLGLLVLLLFPPPDAQAQAPAGAAAVRLQPGDLIKVEIWREPEMSGEFLVDGRGMVTLPLLGERTVTEIPLDSLRAALTEEYRVHLRNPSINIVPLRKLLVLGAVREPGPFEVDPTETVIGAIALAGGIDPSGSLKRVDIVRDGAVVVERVPIDATITGLELRSGDQIMVGERSWLARNQNLVISVLLAVPSTIFTITRIVQ